MITQEPDAKQFTPALIRTTMTFAMLAALCAMSWAASEKVLYSFHGGDGWGGGSVIVGPKGTLYGATGGGGTCAGLGCGVIFRLARGTSGKWHETVLHDFAGSDGEFPGTLALDKAGNLYGTTFNGGTGCGYGCGVVFQLKRGTGGKWTYKVLHFFDVTDGAEPDGTLIFDSRGSLYGTASAGGNISACYNEGGCGLVFKLTPDKKGNWSETVVYAFNGQDGGGPSGIIFDSPGNLYGTNSYGGANQGGTVFKLSPGKHGEWTEEVLHSFSYGTRDGDEPSDGIVFDTSGNLYGTTTFGGMNGPQGWGTAFKLTPTGGGKWEETIVHRFDRAKFGGGYVSSGAVLDQQGNLYGAANWGGRYKCPTGGGLGCGVVFKLTPTAKGKWGETVLHSFGKGNDGSGPGALILDSFGRLYGVAYQGGYTGYPCGPDGCGVVFEVTP